MSAIDRETGMPIHQTTDEGLRVDVVVDHYSPTGGMALALLRLSRAVVDVGYSVRVISDTPTGFSSGSGIEHVSLPVGVVAGSPEIARNLLSHLRARSADLVIVATDSPDLLELCTRSSGKVVLSAQEWSPMCPSGSRYRSSDDKECHVSPGARCLVARLGARCATARETMSFAPISRQRRFARLLKDITVWVPSSQMYQTFADNGVPETRLEVVPNLGMSLTADELIRLSALRGAAGREFHSLGRLSQTKGAHLLPAIDMALGGALVLHGEGYLHTSLAQHFGARLKPVLSQTEVARLLLWSRGIVFPSVWPEPGGIVGIDAQIFGVPLAAFAVGAAVDWPSAHLVPGRDPAALGRALADQEPRTAPRDARSIATRMTRYHAAVGKVVKAAAVRAVTLCPQSPETRASVTECLLEAAC
jgi:glycosyltransferase involved in cell wall biosynthesis